MYVHLVAHARGNLAPLADVECARWLWERLRAGFPDAVAASLMPDHPHLVAPESKRLRRRFAAILGAFARFFGMGALWQPIPEPAPLVTPDKLQRAVRYVLLNPNRPWRHAGRVVQLARDPLEWLWSTHRDVVGAVVDPWVESTRLERALEWRSPDFRASFHRYVSSDPHVNVEGTPLPERVVRSEIPRGSIDDILAAALAATREPPAAVRRRSAARRLFVALAYHQGWRHPTHLAAVCGIAHPATVCRLAQSCPTEWLDAAALCLGDPRLAVRLERSKSLSFAAEQRVVDP